MNESILANKNLVSNGDFREGLIGWKTGSPTDNVRTASDNYQGARISFMRALNGGSASQVVTMPKTRSDQARYFLSFLCENQHSKPGRLVIRLDQQNLEREIILEPGPARDEQQDNQRLLRGEPLDFVPRFYEIELDMPINEQEPLIVSVFSPLVESGDEFVGIHITRINIRLELLEPAKLQNLRLDDQRLPAERAVPLCLGASFEKRHAFGVELVPDNVWLNTKAALLSDDNPQGAIVADPGWGSDHPLDDVWWLECPVIGDQEPYEFTMRLENEYTAEPCLLKVSLGHHRLMFSQVQEAAYYPVLELGQSVRLGVQVASFYSGFELPGRTVTWSVVGEESKVQIVADAQGWAYFDYQPTAAGDFIVQASVDSLYYESGVFTQGLTVQVLASDPWKEVMAVVEGVPMPWEDRTGYPNRGSDYSLQLKLPPDSPLIGTDLSLHWSGVSHEQLGVDVNPALEAPVNVANDSPSWTLTSEDREDGLFELSLQCSKLLHGSPKKRMSLARNRVEIGEVREANKFPVVNENESVLLRIQVLHLLTSGEGDPVQNALVDWITPEGTVHTVTGSGGWANLLYQPASAGSLDITARVRAHSEAQATEHVFKVIAHATSPWKSEVRILLDEVEVDRVVLGLLCHRGESHVLKLLPVAGSSLIGQNVTLSWRDTAPDIGLTVTDLGDARPLPADGLQWTLASSAATSRSSLFELKLSTPALNDDRELSGRLFTADLREELSVQLDQVFAAPLDNAFHPCLGATHDFNVLPNPLSPLVGLDMQLTWTGTPADELDAIVTPAPGTAVPVGDGGARWALDFCASESPGEFTLTASLPQLALSLGAHPMRLGHNKVQINAYRESAVDAVVGQDPVWSWVQVFSLHTNRAVAGVPVEWRNEHGTAKIATDAEGWSGSAYSPSVAGERAVEAVVTSLFDDYKESKNLTVNALASDPWEDVKISFQDWETHTWGQKTFFPRRNIPHTFRIWAEPDNPLFGQEITLGMTGTGPLALGGIHFEPPLGVPILFDEAVKRNFSLKAGDLKDGSFALRLAATRLASLSPANAMSLGEGAQVYRLVVSASAQQTLDWGEELVEQVSVVSSINGQPIAGVEVTWRNADLGTVTGLTDFYGVAKIRFTPKTPGISAVSASVGDSPHSESVRLEFTLNEPREISELYEADPHEWGPEVYAVAKVVSSRTGEPLEGVEVYWDFSGPALRPSLTDKDGIARLTFKLERSAPGRLWAWVKGGLGGWNMASTIYNADERVIVTLTSTDTDLLVGEPASAQVKVVALDGVTPLPGWRVDWAYPGLSLSATATDQNGMSFITFMPAVAGRHLLQATVGFEDKDSLEFTIDRVVIKSLESPDRYLMPGESASARVAVFMQLSDEPVEDIRVTWTYPGVPIKASLTDHNGEAEVTFTPTELGKHSLEAMIGPDDKQSLEFEVDKPVIDSLTSAQQEVFVGQSVSATVKVLTHNDGEPFENIKVDWKYPGLTLPSKVTDKAGIANITFSPQVAGEHALTATVMLSEPKSLVFRIVEPARIVHISSLTPTFYINNSTGVVVAGIEPVAAGVDVVWSSDMMSQSKVSVTDANGETRTTLNANQFPETPIAVIKATVNAGTPYESSRSDRAWVLDKARVSNYFVLDSSQIWLPLENTVSFRRGADIRLSGINPSNGKRCAVFCTRPEAVFNPPAGRFINVIPSSTFWTMDTRAIPMGVQFAVVLSTEDMQEQSCVIGSMATKEATDDQ